ncbi:MAG: hypothetical protein P8179_05630 [Candidatus Thiodiazotropha sp.]|jgi:hypothetical protein
MNTKISIFITFAIILSVTQIANADTQSNIRILSCVSDGKSKDGEPYYKWEATFDTSLFPKGTLNYELKQWTQTKNSNNGKAFTYPLKVTPKTLEFYEKVRIGNITDVLITVVDRKTLEYSNKYDKSNKGTCTIRKYETKI